MARRLIAIVATDIVGYSRLMGANEAGTLATIKSHRAEILEPMLTRGGGRVVKYMGDGALLEFDSVVEAVRFTVQMQLALRDRNSELPEDQRVIYRVGVNIGDVLVDGDDIYGDGVNVASRLEGFAQPGDICVSRTVRSHVAGKLKLDFEDLGERRVKNIAAPVSVHRVILNDKAKALPAARPNLINKRNRSPITLAAIVLALLVAGLGWFQFWTPGGSGQPDAAINLAAQSNRLAVLPFRNISDDPEQDYFALGLAEDLIADLTTIRGLAVIARTSSFQVDDNSGTSHDIANQLGARYFIGGSVRRSRDTLRISVDLVDASTGTTIWAERFDGSDDDVFEFQNRILAQIVKALDIVLAPAQMDALQSGRTKSPKAYEAYLQGLKAVSELKHIDIEGNTLARDAFERAIRIDPGFAEAYAGLAWTNWLHFATINYYSFEHRNAAFDLAEQSISIADNALAHRTLAKRHYRIFGTGSISGGTDLGKATEELRTAVALEPGNADMLADFASLLALGDGASEGLKLVDLAISLNPDHPVWYQFSRGLNLLFLGRYTEAANAFRESAKDIPSWNTPHIFLAVALALDGNERLARLALVDYEERGHVSPSKTYQDAFFRRWPMAPDTAEKFAEGLTLLGVSASAN